MKRWSFIVACVATAATHLSSQDQPLLAVARDVDARDSCAGGLVANNPKTWWRAEIRHNGSTLYSTDDGYQYYRTALQYGADNSGKKDSSDAINKAITAGNRPANTVTTRPAYVYIEPGVYKISNSIGMLVNTFLVGDALNPPTFIGDPSLGENPVIQGFDPFQEPIGATKNFYMSVRNIIISTEDISPQVDAFAMDWSVSQGCTLSNIHIKMPSPSNHIGITMNKGGSGTIISDSTIEGGAVGIRLQNQQYILKNLTFSGCGACIYVYSVFVATLQGVSFKNCHFGLDIGRNGSAGAISIVDSSVTQCDAGVNAYATGTAQGSLVLDNFQVSSAAAVKNSDGVTLLAGSVPPGQAWIMGNSNTETYKSGKMVPLNRPGDLVVNGRYFTARAPQYEGYGVDQIINVKHDPDFTVYGDNKHDDGPAINGILKKYAGCKIVFFPQDIYLTRETIHVPPGSRIVGEVLSVISGAGPIFQNPTSPQPIIMVGKSGETGVAQVSDMLFSVADISPGAIVVQVNMAGTNPGDMGFWNCVIRVGGSTDSLVSKNCGASDPGACKAAFALFQAGRTSSGYFENIWGWVADHPLDPNLPGQNIAVGRGALIQSNGPTWFVGTAFEHCVLYQYNLHRASNVYIGMQQTEAPYWQGRETPQRAPAPWSAETSFGDPDFLNCAAQGAAANDQCFRAWASFSSGSSSIVIHGSALWSFFNRMNDNANVDGGCDATGGICQLNMVYAANISNTFWFSLSSKAAENVIYDASGGKVQLATQKNNAGGWGAVIAAYMKDEVSHASGPGGGSAADAPTPGSPGASEAPKENGVAASVAGASLAVWYLVGFASAVMAVIDLLS